MDEMMNTILHVSELITAIVDQTQELESHMFMAMICMLIEERCKRDDLDVVQVAEDLFAAINDVNADYGKYEGGFI